MRINDLARQVATPLETAPGEYDIEAIAQELADLTDGSDIDAIDSETYWAVVARHEL